MNGQKANTRNTKLNNIDLQIINFLQKDGRMPFAQIAKQMDVSTGTVRLHYQKLIENGAIQIAAITNPLRIGHSRMAIIGINADGHRLREIANEISALIRIKQLEGEYCVPPIRKIWMCALYFHGLLQLYSGNKTSKLMKIFINMCKGSATNLNELTGNYSL